MSSSEETDSMNPMIAFIWVYTSAFATGFKYLGAQPKDAVLLSRRDLD